MSIYLRIDDIALSRLYDQCVTDTPPPWRAVVAELELIRLRPEATVAAPESDNTGRPIPLAAGLAGGRAPKPAQGSFTSLMSAR
jgi:hypothetical protein